MMHRAVYKIDFINMSLPLIRNESSWSRVPSHPREQGFELRSNRHTHSISLLCKAKHAVTAYLESEQLPHFGFAEQDI